MSLLPAPDQKKCLVIAEIGNNHNGSLERAKELIDSALAAGADVVKFQKRHLKSLYRQGQNRAEDLGAEYVIDLLKKFELTDSEHESLFLHTQKMGIKYLCTPWDLHSLCFLSGLGVKTIKIASADFCNIQLIDRALELGMDLILSTGMTTTNEISTVANYLKERQAKFALLHCNSTYPARPGDINLNFMPHLRNYTNIIGYSGHERGINISVAALALGAQIIERHITLDKEMEGPDHAASLTPAEFSTMVTAIRLVEESLGSSSSERVVSQGELINRENLGKSVCVSRKCKIGHKFTKDDLTVASPGRGLSPLRIKDLIGKSAKRDFLPGDFLYESDCVNKKFDFIKPILKRRWGVPVRYHDFRDFYESFSPDVWEFHMSYKDLDFSPLEEWHNENYSGEVIVHAPELLEGGVLMDLTSPDQDLADYSAAQLEKVFDKAEELVRFFPDMNNRSVKVVANLGGFSRDEPLDDNEANSRFRILIDSVQKVNRPKCELLAQNMAPYPWHFGGQRFQNILINPTQIKQFCEATGLRFCLDISHAAMACNDNKWNLGDFILTVAEYVGHIHISDAKGVNGEGCQIGYGDIDFPSLIAVMGKIPKSISFIPEIWQGHKDGGLEFHRALTILGSMGL